MTGIGVLAMAGCAAGQFIDAIAIPVFAVHDFEARSIQTRGMSAS